MVNTTRKTFRHLWQHHRLLTLAFAASIVLLVVFTGRFAASAIYWSQHRNEPIEPWMTIGYVARSHQVKPEALQLALGLDPRARDRRPLIKLADDDLLKLSAMIETLEAAIADEKARRKP